MHRLQKLQLQKETIEVMEKYKISATDATVLGLMQQTRHKLAAEQGEESTEVLLLEQKIIYASLIYATAHQETDKELPPVDRVGLARSIVEFVQKLNRIAMQNYEQNEGNGKEQERLINKTVQITGLGQVKKLIADDWQLDKLRILNHNNLSCLYKRRKKHGVALRSINYALQLEEKLLGDRQNCQKYDIVPTYLNKAAIYSQMGRHKEALGVIGSAKRHIDEIESELIRQIEAETDEDRQKRLVEKRHYGLYMKMLILYNMGAEKEHLRLSEAVEYYKQAKQVATIIGNTLMITKLTDVIGSLNQENMI